MTLQFIERHKDNLSNRQFTETTVYRNDSLPRRLFTETTIYQNSSLQSNCRKVFTVTSSAQLLEGNCLCRYSSSYYLRQRSLATG